MKHVNKKQENKLSLGFFLVTIYSLIRLCITPFYSSKENYGCCASSMLMISVSFNDVLMDGLINDDVEVDADGV